VSLDEASRGGYSTGLQSFSAQWEAATKRAGLAKKNEPSSRRPMGLRFSAVLGVSTAAAVTEQQRSTEQTTRNRERDMVETLGFGGQWVPALAVNCITEHA
tara:strand:+ start:13176 stop:13478 length:303 start_codon:yes stop_codon:yes gene_type:complete